jgi:hypothetical protein
MGWEERRGGKVYYRSVRVDGRPTKVYLGKGAAAEAQAERVAQAQKQRQAECDAWRRERDRLAGAEQHLRDLQVLAAALVRVTLHGAGFHLHRGEYRRRRHARDGHNGQGSDQT